MDTDSDQGTLTAKDANVREGVWQSRAFASVRALCGCVAIALWAGCLVPRFRRQTAGPAVRPYLNSQSPDQGTVTAKDANVREGVG